MNYTIKLSLLILILGCFFYSCEDDHQARYEDPPWLGGSIIETLEERGNYEVLLDLMRKAGYEESIDKGLYTLFAANDSSYEAYFSSKGITSVEDITEQDAVQLFTLNLLNTPRSRQQLIYDFVWNVWQEPGSEVGALFWRIPTRSESPFSTETVRYDEKVLGETLKIRGQEKFVPLITSDFFRDYFGSPDGSDYNFFFPNTPWSGTQWYNANIIEAEVRASNGFVYFLDKAVPHIPSIEEYLRDNQDQYGVYYDMLQRFAKYTFAGYDEYDAKIRLYTKGYTGISNIALEGGPSNGSAYERRNAYSALIPSDNILQDYLDQTVLQYYPHLDSVPEVTLLFIVQAHLTNHFELASKMDRAFYNAYGDILPLNSQTDIIDASLCSNGAFYAVNKILEPRAFTTVPGPIFYNSNYTTFLYALNQSKMITSLTYPDVIVSMFAPPDDKLEEAGIRYYKEREQLEKLRSDGVWDKMEDIEVLSFVQDHVVLKSYSDFTGEGFIEMNSGNYIYYNNNKIEAGGNQEMDIVADIVKAEDSGVNGILFHLDNPIIEPKQDASIYISKDPDLTEFYSLIAQAGLIDTIIDPDTEEEYSRIKFLLEAETWTALAPTNAAIAAARSQGILPDSIPELQQFVRYHFIRDNVIFDDGNLNGIFGSARIDSATVAGIYPTPLFVDNSIHDLSITDKSGQVIKVNHSKANDLVLYGVVHKIDKVLLNE